MKKKNKGKKSLTAIGTVVAAGLTPGIVTGTPVQEPTNNEIELTAADAVAIDGETFDFDELFAMRGTDGTYGMPQLVYGPPRTVYGPPPAFSINPDVLRSMVVDDKENACVVVLNELATQFQNIVQVDNNAVIRYGDIIRDLKMDSSQLGYMSQWIEDRLNVQLTPDMLTRLGSLDRIANFIVEVVTPIKK